MKKLSVPTMQRRRFLKTGIKAGAIPALTMLGHRPAMAANLGGGYKALVCVYLDGGNDSFNLIAPYGQAEHDAYQAARQFLAVPRGSLLPVNPTTYRDGRSYGFHANAPEIRDLFNQQRLAVVANVGTLVRPVTPIEYKAGRQPVPRQLFSHNDQSDLWMAGNASAVDGFGWAGQMMDRFYGPGQTAPVPSPLISIGGDNVWQTGDFNRAFEVTVMGVANHTHPYHGGPLLMSDAYAQMAQIAAGNAHPMIREHAGVQNRAIEYSQRVNDQLNQAPRFDGMFSAMPLSEQLRMVARLIAVRAQIDPSTTRQVFYVRLGGWDTHSDQNSRHPNLIRQLSTALAEFDRSLNQLGVGDNVTTFTASEFGRSLTPNGSGSDHGWGGHQLVMGGAVRGGDIYGRMPSLMPNSPDAVEVGRIVPTTAVDQLASTLCYWFGLDNNEVNALFPNVRNFSSAHLGFV